MGSVRITWSSSIRILVVLSPTAFVLKPVEAFFVNNFVFVKRLKDFHQKYCELEMVVEGETFGLEDRKIFGRPAINPSIREEVAFAFDMNCEKNIFGD